MQAVPNLGFKNSFATYINTVRKIKFNNKKKKFKSNNLTSQKYEGIIDSSNIFNAFCVAFLQFTLIYVLLHINNFNLHN